MVKEEGNFGCTLQFMAAFLFIIALFSYSPKESWLTDREEFELMSKPILKEFSRKSDQIILEDIENNKFKIIKQDYYNCSKEEILKLQGGDKIQLGTNLNRAYFVKFNGKELTNLNTANEARIQIQIWVFIISIFLLGASLILKIKDRSRKTTSMIILLIFGLFIMIILNLIIGSNHLL